MSKSIYTRNGLFNMADGVFKGKGISSLLKSRDKRADLIAMFGGRDNVPSSVMRAKRARDFADSDEPTSKGRRYTQTGYQTDNKELQRSFGHSGRGVSAGALSIFPQNIGRSVLLLYSNPGDMVFDPFAGQNSRMELCVENGRHYIGYDISTEFMAFNKKRCAYLQTVSKASIGIELHRQDSRDCKFTEDCSGDFTITSPPYYDIEFYGDEKEQLGKAKTYKDFLINMRVVMCENFRCLKPGAFAVWFVNDFRRKGKFHLYHADICVLAQQAGFEMHDLIVVDFGPGIRDSFTNQIVEQRIIPKRHEYALVFRKPT